MNDTLGFHDRRHKMVLSESHLFSFDIILQRSFPKEFNTESSLLQRIEGLESTCGEVVVVEERQSSFELLESSNAK